MLILLPIGLLFLASLAIFLIDRLRPNFGTSWLIAVAASFIAWLTLLILRLRLPTTLSILSWEGPDSILMGRLSLLLDYDAWPYALALMTITLAVVLTDAARTRFDSTPKAWSASLMITGLGLLALQAGTSLTLVLTWVFVDIIELVYLLGLEDVDRFSLRMIIAYGVRLASALMVFWATAQGWHTAGSFTLTEIPESAGFYFLLAAGLRLGVFPLNLPFLQEPNLRRGAGNILRLAPVASSLMILARLPNAIIPQRFSNWTPLFEAMLALAALYAAFRWLSSSDEIEGRPFWIIGWAALAVASVLNGRPEASLAWGIALLLPGSLLFLYFPRIQRMNFLLFFGLIGLLGLPFTLAASGWAGLLGSSLNIWRILLLIAHAVMVLGYLKRAFQRGGEAGALETWARIVYPMGLVIIIQAIIILGLIGWPDSLTLGTWWMALISNLVIILAVVLAWRLGITPPYIQLPASSRVTKAINWLAPRIEPIFRLEWLYQTAWKIFKFLGNILKRFSQILEGDGGILWMILLLVLLITLLTGLGGV
jgi:hypothetical protein